ncbi:helix-turn-helix domain-containing protein [Sulfurimonas sp. HSL1-2]|uniref:helix-turn-helix domain-containing protein n=1 Tax=Thiomicrolovo zhangzhouensis TaxID=3131933 RepID=UPI0031F7D4D4
MTAAAEAAADIAVAVTEFLAASHASTEALRTATLLKTLQVNALISGPKGTGKQTLARVILPGAVVLDARDFDNVLNALESNDEVVLTHIEHCPNITLLFERVKTDKVRMIATASSEYLSDAIWEFFSVKIALPPLVDRPEDVELLISHFNAEADRIFDLVRETSAAGKKPDLSDNAYSLRKQIYFERLMGGVNEAEVMQVMERYLQAQMGSHNDYRKFLHLYEVPLIRTGLRKFKSQLQLAERLGLNRNTLRKKIAENEQFGLLEP